MKEGYNQGLKNHFFRPIFRQKIGFRLGWKRFWEGKIVCKKIGEKSPIFHRFSRKNPNFPEKNPIYVLLYIECWRRRWRSRVATPTELAAPAVVVAGERAMKRCFMKVDEEMVSGGCCRKENGAVNTVRSTPVVGGDVVAVANCGDSRVVICRDGIAIPLSNDHKVKNTSYTNQYCPSLLGPVWTFGNKIKALVRPPYKKKDTTTYQFICNGYIPLQKTTKLLH